jgi:hypothetical protein
MKILERSGMTGCNLCHVPMEACLKLSKQSTQPLVDITAYQSIVRSIRRVIFCIIMSAEDYVNAFEKLLRLGLS